MKSLVVVILLCLFISFGVGDKTYRKRHLQSYFPAISNKVMQPTKAPTPPPTRHTTANVHNLPTKLPTTAQSFLLPPTNSKETLNPLQVLPKRSKAPTQQNAVLAKIPTPLPTFHPKVQKERVVGIPTPVPSSEIDLANIVEYPTAAPSQSDDSAFLQQFRLLNINITQNYQVIYEEFQSMGRARIGGEVSWDNFVASLQNRWLVERAKSLVYITKYSRYIPSKIYSCLNQENASRIVENLLVLTENRKYDVQCNGHVWSTKICSESSSAFCIDCEDPCASNCLDNNVLFPTKLPCNEVTVLGRALAVQFEAEPMEVLEIIDSNIGINNITVRLNAPDIKIPIQCVPFQSGSYVNVFSSELSMFSQSVWTIVNQTVNVLIHSLEPSTQYDLFCQEVNAVHDPFESNLIPLQRLISFKTLCCKRLVVELATTKSSIQSSDHGILVRAEVSSLPSVFIGGVVVASNRNAQFERINIVEMWFSPVGPESREFFLRVSPSQWNLSSCYVIDFALSGTSAQEYQVEFAHSPEICFQNQLNSGNMNVYSRMSNLGNQLILSFNSYVKPRQTGCHELANVTNFRFSQCTRISPNRLLLDINEDSVLKLGDMVNISLFGDTDRLVAFVVQAPLVPLFPRIVITSPSVTSECQDIEVDILLSCGSGGRSWNSMNISVAPLAASDASIVASSLAAKALVSLKSLSIGTIPGGLLPPGFYSISITVCNYFGNCAMGFKRLSVVFRQLPAVILRSPYLRSIPPGRDLIFTAEIVDSSRCQLEHSDFGRKQLRWSIQGLNNASDHSQTVETRGEFFVVSKTYLRPGAAYLISTTIDDNFSRLSSSSQICITVQQPMLRAVLVGSHTRSVRIHSFVEIDASQSYLDSDYDHSSRLQFSWTCSRELPIFLPGVCPLESFIPIGHYGFDSKLKLLATSSFENSAAIVTVFIRDEHSHQDIASVQIISIDESSSEANIALSSVALGERKHGFVVDGSYLHKAPGRAQWFVVDAFHNLVSIDDVWSSTGLTLSTYFHDASSTVSCGKLIVPELLFSTLGHNSLRFRLEFVPLNNQLGLETSFAEISIFLDELLNPGKFQVVPAHGIAFVDEFTMSALNWVHSNLPMIYSFGYCVDGEYFSVHHFSFAVSIRTLLPAGVDRCQLTVMDTLKYTVNVSQTVYVQPSADYQAIVVDDLTVVLQDTEIKFLQLFSSLEALWRSEIESSSSSKNENGSCLINGEHQVFDSCTKFIGFQADVVTALTELVSWNANRNQILVHWDEIVNEIERICRRRDLLSLAALDQIFGIVLRLVIEFPFRQWPKLPNVLDSLLANTSIIGEDHYNLLMSVLVRYIKKSLPTPSSLRWNNTRSWKSFDLHYESRWQPCFVNSRDKKMKDYIRDCLANGGDSHVYQVRVLWHIPQNVSKHVLRDGILVTQYVTQTVGTTGQLHKSEYILENPLYSCQFTFSDGVFGLISPIDGVCSLVPSIDGHSSLDFSFFSFIADGHFSYILAIITSVAVLYVFVRLVMRMVATSFVLSDGTQNAAISESKIENFNSVELPKRRTNRKKSTPSDSFVSDERERVMVSTAPVPLVEVTGSHIEILRTADDDDLVQAMPETTHHGTYEPEIEPPQIKHSSDPVVISESTRIDTQEIPSYSHFGSSLGPMSSFSFPWREAAPIEETLSRLGLAEELDDLQGLPITTTLHEPFLDPSFPAADGLMKRLSVTPPPGLVANDLGLDSFVERALLSHDLLDDDESNDIPLVTCNSAQNDATSAILK